MSCEACHRAHRKCAMPEEQEEACDRCLKRGLVCVRREQLPRGRPPAVTMPQLAASQASSSSHVSTSASSSQPSSSTVSTSASSTFSPMPQPASRSSSSSSGPAMDAEHEEERRRLRISEDALEALFPHSNCLLQYRFASALGSILRENGLRQAPPALASYARIMGEMSAADNSLPLLHAFTTLAIALGLREEIPFPATLANPGLPRNPEFQALDAGAVKNFEADCVAPPEGQQEYLRQKRTDVPRPCSYMVLIEQGKRHMFAGPNWCNWFVSHEEMQQRCDSKPGYYKFWLDTMAVVDDRARRLRMCLSYWLSVPMVYDENGREDFWHFIGRIPDVHVRDRFGKEWLVDITEFDVYACTVPRRLRHSVQLDNFRPYEAPETTEQPSPLTSDEAVLRMPDHDEEHVFNWPMDIEPPTSNEVIKPLEEYLASNENMFSLDDLEVDMTM